VLGEVERLDRLVGGLLDLSRLQAGALAVRRRFCDVHDLARAAAHEATALAPARLVYDLSPELPLVHVDESQIERVLANLLENAARYSPPESAVELAARRLDDRVELTVSDHGPGVPEDERERVFAPFERGSAGAARPGSGLGLAIARGLAEANDSRLTVRAGERGGAVFALSLPAPAPPRLGASRGLETQDAAR
jgi:two-component system sensor histidine kinase KdpD